MAPQGIENIESGLENGRGSEASNLQDLVYGDSGRRAARRTKLQALWRCKKAFSVAGIAARVRPEIASQGIEKIESRLENCMGSEASNLQDLVWGTPADESLAVDEVTGLMALQKKGVSAALIAARVARKWRRKGLKRLNPGSEMVVGRKPRTYKI